LSYVPAGVVWFGSPQLTWQTTYAVLHSASLSREKWHVRSRSLCDELEDMSVDSRLGHWKVAGCMGFDGLVDPVSPSLHVDSVGLLRIWFCSVHSEGFPACRLDDAQAQMLDRTQFVSEVGPCAYFQIVQRWRKDDRMAGRST
jgi:hypothetical protein